MRVLRSKCRVRGDGLAAGSARRRRRRQPFDGYCDLLRGQFPEVAAMLLRAPDDDLVGHRAFPLEHMTKGWSANPLQRLHREVERPGTATLSRPRRSQIVRGPEAGSAPPLEDGRLNLGRHLVRASTSRRPGRPGRSGACSRGRSGALRRCAGPRR